MTNQLQYLPYADKILVLKEGKIEANGTYKELSTGNAFFQKMMTQFGDIDEKKDEMVAEQPKLIVDPVKKVETKEEKGNVT